MKKLFLFVSTIIMFYTNDANAELDILAIFPTIHRDVRCLTIACKNTELPSDEGKCYSCDYTGAINISCMDIEAARQICPNRIIRKGERVNLLRWNIDRIDASQGYNTISMVTECAKNQILGNDGKCHSCDDEKIYFGDFMDEKDVIDRCPKRFLSHSATLLKCPDHQTSNCEEIETGPKEICEKEKNKQKCYDRKLYIY